MQKKGFLENNDVEKLISKSAQLIFIFEVRYSKHCHDLNTAVQKTNTNEINATPLPLSIS